MTTELLLSATLGLAFITVGVHFVWRADRERRRQARLKAQYELFAVRDRVIRAAASGKLHPDSALFAGLVDWINIVIRLDDQADLHFYRWMRRTAMKEGARNSAATMVAEAIGPRFHEDEVRKLVAEVGKAIYTAICANSRMLRIASRTAAFDGDKAPEPLPAYVGSVSLTADQLGSFGNTPAFN